MMKIAVTYENGQVFQHFGHTQQFKLYEVENGELVSSRVVDTNGSGHGALAGFLRECGAEVLICGGIGGGARNALAQAGIQLYPGVSGDADAQMAALLAGSLPVRSQYRLCAPPQSRRRAQLRRTRARLRRAQVLKPKNAMPFSK